MKFPISVELIDDTIYLFQREITEEFKQRVNNLIFYGCPIQSQVFTEIGNDVIYINGTDNRTNYIIVSHPNEFGLFDLYQQSIDFYKTELGYE